MRERETACDSVCELKKNVQRKIKKKGSKKRRKEGDYLHVATSASGA